LATGLNVAAVPTPTKAIARAAAGGGRSTAARGSGTILGIRKGAITKAVAAAEEKRRRAKSQGNAEEYDEDEGMTEDEDGLPSLTDDQVALQLQAFAASAAATAAAKQAAAAEAATTPLLDATTVALPGQPPLAPQQAMQQPAAGLMTEGSGPPAPAEAHP